MSVARRQLLLGCVALTGVASAANISAAKLRRVSQHELDEAIEPHATWLSGDGQGRRAVFSGCDLAGLDFRSTQADLVDLRYADFTAADLTGVRGNNVSLCYASLHSTRLSWSRLTRPSFICSGMRGAICDNALWGWDERSRSSPSLPNGHDGAVFHHTDAGRSDFRRSMVRGMFVDTRFTCANFGDANLSYSLFLGGGVLPTSFFDADISRADFRSANIQAALFRTERCSGVDFTEAEIGYGVKLPPRRTLS